MSTLLWNCTFFKEDKTAHFVFALGTGVADFHIHHFLFLLTFHFYTEL